MTAPLPEEKYLKENQVLRREVQTLKEINADLLLRIQFLEEEINRLKNKTKKPKLQPSRIGLLEKLSIRKKKKVPNKGRKKLKVHKIITLKPDALPEGSRLLKYREYIVQDIRMEAENIKYRRAVYRKPNGCLVFAKLPPEIEGSRYGVHLRAHILSLYYEMHVSQRDILSSLQGHGIEISAAQVSRILTQGHDGFHKEKQEILEAALGSSSYIVVDDTGLRQKGHNGFCTHIGNESFAFFQSSISKSRINFLEILRGKHRDYRINEYGLEHLKTRKFPEERRILLKRLIGKTYADKESYTQVLKGFAIREKYHLRLAYEAGLMGSILMRRPEFPVIVSDAARQFNVFHHAACWIHTERGLSRISPENAMEQEMLNTALRNFWAFYKKLRGYKEKPCHRKKIQLTDEFDDIFRPTIPYSELTAALKLIHKRKQELLLVLEHPQIPLHNNTSERDIREAAKKRKISAGTRSDAGRDARAAFLSLKKSCMKLGISFREYLLDRLHKKNQIPYLPDLILQNTARPP